MKELPARLLQDLEGINCFDRNMLIAAHQQAPVTSVRINPAKDLGLFQDNALVPWCSTGAYLPQRPVFTLDPAYHAGAYYVQEASSMFLHHMLDSCVPDKKNLRILDLCAAPGGKSTLLASWMDKTSLLVSNEVIRTRASILEENMTRWGYMNTWVISNDPRLLGSLSGYFDIVVVDAPCSGSGLFRKDPRALDEWSEANVQLCSERQQRILADIWPALKEDGIIIYATCSFSPQEDEEILDWMGANFEIESLRCPLPEEWGICEVYSPVKKNTGYRFFPGKVKGEGFFIAAFRKKEVAKSLHVPKFKSMNNSDLRHFSGWILDEQNDAVFIYSNKDTACAICSKHEQDYQILHKAVFLRKVGVMLGSAAGKDWLPDHEVALSINVSESIRSADLNREQALRYLKKEDIGISGLDKGWLLARYNGLGLGWMKSLGNRINNYLPKQWRIRMDITDE